MIYFKKLGEMGRLGNQMFQYAALMGLCLENGYYPMIPDLGGKSCHGQFSLLNELSISADLYKGGWIKGKYKESSWRLVDENFYNIKDNRVIEGYFQSIFYFKNHQRFIKEEFTPKSHYMSRAKRYLDGLREVYNCEIVSVHLRRGDNMTWKNSHHYRPAYEEGGVYWQYFERAKEVFKDKSVKFLVFTGGTRGGDENNATDLEWCKGKFVGDEYIFSEGQRQIDDLARIMSCDHNILSHVSSFGWWAAYLNKNKNCIRVAPEYYHPNEPLLKRYMFYPEDYVLV